MGSFFKFEELVVYQKSLAFVDEVYSIVKKYPDDELYGLTSQLRRASVSISLNIAEGSAKSKRDFCRFINFARGSVNECVAILGISKRRDYITEQQLNELKEMLAEISRMLSGLKKSIDK